MKEDPSAIAVRGPAVTRARVPLRSAPSVAVLTVLGLAALAHVVPGLEPLRLFGPVRRAPTPEREAMMQIVDSVGEAEIDMETTHRPDLAQPEQATRPAGARLPIAAGREAEELPPVSADRPPLSIVDPERSLDRFFEALGRTARKLPGAVTRVVYHGDSMVASDFVTGTLRRKLQDEFGDAGHGFVLIANPWPAYFHNDVYRLASRGWRVSRIVGPYLKDGLYGFGGVAFRGAPGLRSRVGTAESGSYGRKVSRFEVAYLEEPGGGELLINLDGEQHSVIDTNGPEKRSAFAEIRASDGEHQLEIVTRRGASRLFGVVLEREVPGVVLDAVGIVGARIRFLDKQDDQHWAEQLAWRSPNLLVFQFGANESSDGFAYPMEDYHRTMKDVLAQAQRAVPDAGCLIVAPMDRARKEGTALVTVPVLPLIVEQQELVAREVGCAFFNTFQAMGGRGSMARWVRRGLGAGDFTHPTSVGAERIGTWLYLALMERYEEYRLRRSDPSPPGAPSLAGELGDRD